MKNRILIFCLLAFFNGIHGQDYWKPIVSNTNSDLFSVSFGNDLTGYICGSDSLLLKSNDGGKTWNRIIPKGISFKLGGRDLVHVKFVNPMVGYIVQSNHATPLYQGTLYKTIDGGQNWIPNSGVNIAPWKSFYFNEDNGFQIGSAYFQGKMVGKQVKGNWQNVCSFSWSPDEFLRAVDFYDTLTGIVGGDSGYVYRTFNGGESWDTIRASVKNPILCLKYISDSIIMGGAGSAGNYPRSVYSNDAGTTWVEGGSPFQFVYYEIHDIILSQKDGVIRVGQIYQSESGFIERHADAGSSGLQYANFAMNAAAMKNDTIAFAVGNNGTILCNGIDETNKLLIPDKLSLTGVYPNPVSGVLSVKSESDFSFQLLASDGKLIVKEENCMGLFNLDVAEFASGVYTLKIVLRDNHTEFHKIAIQ